ncbi:MAG: hypothetical protein DRJ66_05280 [Thermoprotei archaeon]|nr:MAG: hypothetical protein DRJ66_05280 [Thermoprotei archaeon]
MKKDMVLKLRELGFSEYEASVYVALLDLGEATADEISKLSGVPLPRVYTVLDDLIRKGFVDVTIGRPKRYFLIDPNEALDRFIEGKKREMEEELRKIKLTCEEFKRLIEPKYIRIRYKINPEELLLALPDLKVAEAKSREIMEEAKREILIMSHTFSWASRIMDVLERAINERGVDVKVLMSISPLTEDTVKRLREIGAKVKKHPAGWYPVRGTVVDRKAAVFVIWASRPSSGVGHIYRPHYTENMGLVRLLVDVFEKYWSESL